MAAAAVTEMDEMVKNRLNAEMDIMALEDRRSRQVHTSQHDNTVDSGKGVDSSRNLSRLVEERLRRKSNRQR